MGGPARQALRAGGQVGVYNWCASPRGRHPVVLPVEQSRRLRFGLHRGIKSGRVASSCSTHGPISCRTSCRATRGSVRNVARQSSARCNSAARNAAWSGATGAAAAGARRGSARAVPLPHLVGDRVTCHPGRCQLHHSTTPINGVSCRRGAGEQTPYSRLTTFMIGAMASVLTSARTRTYGRSTVVGLLRMDARPVTGLLHK